VIDRSILFKQTANFIFLYCMKFKANNIFVISELNMMTEILAGLLM
jgi:hypothetical protein